MNNNVQHAHMSPAYKDLSIFVRWFLSVPIGHLSVPVGNQLCQDLHGSTQHLCTSVPVCPYWELLVCPCWELPVCPCWESLVSRNAQIYSTSLNFDACLSKLGTTCLSLLRTTCLSLLGLSRGRRITSPKQVIK